MGPASPVVPVVCALIERDGRVLVARRPPHKALGLKWEFPGGKIEPGEQPAQALSREIHEELGCTIVPARCLPISLHDYGDVVIEMQPFICTLADASPEPVAHEHVALAWHLPDELGNVDLAAADLPVLAHYLDQLARERTARER